MCVIAFAWQCHSRYPLVVVANRDEYHARPTRALEAWGEDPDVIGGRDLQAGGSWMGVRRGGRFAAVTNVRSPARAEGTQSRGALVGDFLLAGDAAGTAAAAAAQLVPDAAAYGPFNLLLSDGQNLAWITNAPAAAWQPVAPGIHGVSNGSPSFRPGPTWPKVERLKVALEACLCPQADSSQELDLEPLLVALSTRELPADDTLPDTGVGPTLERRLAPVFISGKDYGTRCSTVLLVNAAGDARMHERRFGPNGRLDGENEMELPARC